MLVLNFAHPLTDEQRTQIETLAQARIERIVEVASSVDQSNPLLPQVVALVDACGLSSYAWQSSDLMINPPGLTSIAMAVIAEIHGRRGSFPSIIRMRPVEAAHGTRYEVAELINLQHVRETARTRR
jgi:hypothetical protein